MTLSPLLEFYDPGDAPHEALGRAARTVSRGALYLGGGIGVEKQATPKGEVFHVVSGSASKPETFTGPLSAVIRAFTLAGESGMSDSPGGSTKISDPAVAARLRELLDLEASAKRELDRMEARIARRNKNGGVATVFSPGRTDENWEQRRVEELKSDLQRLAAERAKLLSTGNVEEVEQKRPGTNFTKIPPQNVKKLSGIISHYAKMAHPFSACVRDQIKHGLSDDHAKRRCAVVTDLGKGTTKWRNGGGKKKVAEAELEIQLALARTEVCVEQFGLLVTVQMVEQGLGDDVPTGMKLIEEGVTRDWSLLALAGHPLAEAAFGLQEKFEDKLHPRDPHGMFKSKLGGLKKPGDKFSLFGIKVSASGGRGFRISDERGDLGKQESVFAKNPVEVASIAVNRSVRSTNPQSIGGATKYPSLAHVPGDRPGDPKAVDLKKGSTVTSGGTVIAQTRRIDITPETPRQRTLRQMEHSPPPKPRAPGAPARSPVPELAGRKTAAAHIHGKETVERANQVQLGKVKIADLKSGEHEKIAQVLDFGAGEYEKSKLTVHQMKSKELKTMASKVRAAAKDARRRAGLKEGEGGIGVMLEGFNAGSSSSSSSSSKYDESKHPRGQGRFVQKGASGSDVKKVQQKVGAKVDGQFGTSTVAKVKAFQKTHGLKVDGIVGAQTNAALAGRYATARKTTPGAIVTPKLKKSKKPSSSPTRARGGLLV